MGKSNLQRKVMAALAKIPGQIIAGHVKALNYAKPHIARHLKFAKTELTPPGPGELAAGLGGILANGSKLASMSFMKNTVQQNVVSLMVGAEIACWFFLGECLGKGSVIGYDTRKKEPLAFHGIPIPGTGE